MTHKKEGAGDQCRPLVFNIATFRQWYGKQPLTQRELAKLAGISESQVFRLEKARSLSRGLETLLRVAIALEARLDGLIKQDRIADLHAEIEERRRELRLGTNGESGEACVA